MNTVLEPGAVVSLPPLNLNTNTATFTAWINPQETEQDYAVLVSYRSPVQGTANGINYGPNGGLSYHWNDAQDTWDYDSGIVPPVGQWSFVAVTISPTNSLFYLFDASGMTSATNAVSVPVQAVNTPGFIGGDDHDPNFIGDIDEVAIYNQVLSQTQLTNLYNVAVTGKLPPQNVILNIQPSGGNVIISWNPAGGTLLQATSLTGPWTADTSATSPYTTTATGAQMFYRVQVQ